MPPEGCTGFQNPPPPNTSPYAGCGYRDGNTPQAAHRPATRFAAAESDSSGYAAHLAANKPPLLHPYARPTNKTSALRPSTPSMPPTEVAQYPSQTPRKKPSKMPSEAPNPLSDGITIRTSKIKTVERMGILVVQMRHQSIEQHLLFKHIAPARNQKRALHRPASHNNRHTPAVLQLFL